jgi:hypothetical protein
MVDILPVFEFRRQECHFQNDLPDDSYSVGALTFQTMQFIPLFENRLTITTIFNVSQTVARFLSDRRFVRFRPLASSTAPGVQRAASALERQTVLVALAYAALTA